MAKVAAKPTANKKGAAPTKASKKVVKTPVKVGKKATPSKATKAAKAVAKGAKGSKVAVKANAPKGPIIKVRAKKDANAPKKARSAYTYYLEEAHARIKVTNPDAPFGIVSKQISAEWKSMSEAQKSRYEDLSRQDKARYAEAKSDYVPAPGYGSDGKALYKHGKHRRAKKDKSLPKGALSAYIIFCTQMRPVIKGENPDVINTEILKETGNRWRAMTAEQKQPWEDLAAQDKIRYEQEIAAHRLNN